MIRYRQGDVLLTKVNQLPETAAEKKVDSRIVLAYGEVTGHAHAITADQAKLFWVQSDVGLQVFVVVEAYAELRHEEHDLIPLQAGIYQVTRQRQYIATTAMSDRPWKVVAD